MNNRNLLIIFITCLALFFAGKFFRGKRTASFDPVIVAVDTSLVDRIKFMPAGAETETFELKRSGDIWKAVKGDIEVDVQPAGLQSIFSTLASLNAQRIVTSEGSKYADYEIEEGKASRLEVWQKGKKMADLEVGGFRFDQASRTASTYIKKAGKPEVYLIDGFAGMGLKARFDQFRDKKLVKADAANLTSIGWVNAAGNQQKIQQEDGAWYYAGMEAVDSASFSTYLTGLVNAQGSSFSELRSAQGLNLIEQLTLAGNDMSDPTIITAYQNQDTLSPFLIHSTANPEALFNSDSTGLYKKIFTDLRQFWPDGQ